MRGARRPSAGSEPRGPKTGGYRLPAFPVDCLSRMSVHEHKSEARARAPSLAAAIITVSDTRTLATDGSGQAIERLLEAAGHRAVSRVVVSDDASPLALALQTALRSDIDAVILSGGTGISRRDGTVEVVRRFLDAELPGFGELFRALSFEEIGAAAMLSRATGGISSGKAVFSLPGSTAAVTLAMERLILPELAHVVSEARKG